MARVALTKKAKLQNQKARLSKWAKLTLVANDKRQKDLADAIGVTTGAVNQCFNNKTITVEMLLGVFKVCEEVNREELERLLHE